jgi:hypothetical protein
MASSDSSDSELVIVESFSTPQLAHVARGALHSIGIQAVVDGEHLARVNRFFSNATGGVTLRVRARDYAAARKFLDKAEQAHRARPHGPRSPCPDCHSTNTRLVRMGIKLALIAWFRGRGPALPPVYRLRCDNCGLFSAPPQRKKPAAP